MQGTRILRNEAYILVRCKEAIIDHTLVKRTGTIDDVVKAVCFLIKDAPFMTGSVLRIDGGYVLGGEKVSPMPNPDKRDK